MLPLDFVGNNRYKSDHEDVFNERTNLQGYSYMGHCMMLLLFIFSLILIVALMYWMVSRAVAVALLIDGLFQD